MWVWYDDYWDEPHRTMEVVTSGFVMQPGFVARKEIKKPKNRKHRKGK